ncbi:hypothetical protein B9Z40_16190 [Limnohabitans sp. 15K]|nr:hypothetical protein B9Z40_16190 [Limnohabitans sp. 15K]
MWVQDLALLVFRAFIRTPATTQRKQGMSYTSNEFTVDEVGFIQIALTKVLAAVARGELDLNRLAREELASRGLNDQGNWIGFDAAKKHHNV